MISAKKVFIGISSFLISSPSNTIHTSTRRLFASSFHLQSGIGRRRKLPFVSLLDSQKIPTSSPRPTPTPTTTPLLTTTVESIGKTQYLRHQTYNRQFGNIGTRNIYSGTILSAKTNNMDEEATSSRPRRSSRRASTKQTSSSSSEVVEKNKEESLSDIESIVQSENESDDNSSVNSTSKKKKTKAKTTKKKTAKATSAATTKTKPKRKKSSDTKQPAKKKKTTTTTKAPQQRITERHVLEKQWDAKTVTQENKSYNFKIISWNVAGLRALMKNHPNALSDLAKNHDADVICLQETKLQDVHVDDPKLKINGFLLNDEGYDGYYSCSTAKKGYSGVAVFIKRRQVKGNGTADGTADADADDGSSKTNKSGTKKQAKMGDFFTKPKKSEVKQDTKSAADDTPTQKETGDEETLSIDIQNLIPEHVSKVMGYTEHDQEGRIITVDFPLFTFANLYVPNSGQKLDRLTYRTDSWDKDLLKFMQDKHKERNVPVVWLGDLNVAHTNLDVWNDGAKHLAKQAGTTPEERASFQQQLDVGEKDKKEPNGSSLSPFVDAFRYFYPTAEGHYTYWSQRAGNREPNKGLRLDYFVCSRDFFDNGEDQKAVVRDSYMIPEQLGSDHCPVVLEIEIF